MAKFEVGGTATADKTQDKKPGTRFKARKARVNEAPAKMHMASGNLSESQAPKVHGILTPVPGGVLISAVLAETVRVAEYANVVIGPVGMSWVHGNIDMELLSEIDWDADPDDLRLTPEQQREYDKAYNGLRGTMRITEAVMAEDRETVERSIRQYEAREAAREAAIATAAASTDVSAPDTESEKPKRRPRQRTASGRTRSKR
jgi:hypothetical protein